MISSVVSSRGCWCFSSPTHSDEPMLPGGLNRTPVVGSRLAIVETCRVCLAGKVCFYCHPSLLLLLLLTGFTLIIIIIIDK